MLQAVSHFTPQTRCHGEGKEDTRVTPRARHSSPVCCLSLPGLQLVGQRLRPPPGPSSRELATQRLVPQPPGAPAAPAGKSRAQAGNCPHRGPLPAPGAAAHPPPPACLPALTRGPAAEAAAGGQAVLAGLGVTVTAVALPPPLQLGAGARTEPPAPRHAGPGSTCRRPRPLPLPAPAAILSEGTAALRAGRLPTGRAGSGAGEAKRGRARLGLGWETRGA